MLELPETHTLANQIAQHLTGKKSPPPPPPKARTNSPGITETQPITPQS